MRIAILLCWVLLVSWRGGAIAATQYELPAQRAAQWLAQQANADGSWGPPGELQFLYTAEATLALGAANRRGPAYYAGMTWLKNHAALSVDFSARRVLALRSEGNDVSGDLLGLQSAQALAAAANGGWGVSSSYQGSPLDTALTLQALWAAGSSTGVASATAYLKLAQLTGSDKGWSLAHETVSDPITTAHVVQALVPLRATDATLAVPVANALSALNAKVTTASPASHRALAAIAFLRDSADSPAAVTLLTSLVSSQDLSGTWGGEVYSTALALRALATAMRSDIAAQKQPIAVPDEALRSAINQALGRNALDALNRGELERLTTLDIANRGVSSLVGLEAARNLTTLDARNNNISAISPIEGLPQLTNKDLSGNPCPGCTPQIARTDADVPLPLWALAMLGTALMGVLRYADRRRGAAT